ncbi:MAG: serine/threonine protein phosphatase [Pirellulales bacterium]|nr:serine/threonine protein phosphatase [Pirellulales bacterium]
MSVLRRIFGPRSRIAEAEQLYAIGDIHGRDDLLAILHDRIEAEIRASDPGCSNTVVYLGDYVDRGPGSKAVVDRLLDNPVKGARSIHLMGNHEDTMLQFLEGEDVAREWLTMGGGATLRSYGLSLRSNDSGQIPLETVCDQLKAAIPARHREFYNSLKLYHESGDYLFVHAGLRPGLALEDQEPSDLLWIRKEFLQSNRNHGKLVVHGHAAALRPVVKRNRICVDTAAHVSDTLTALVLKGRSRRFLSASL